MKKETVLQTVQNSASSIFSKQDVLNLINSITESQDRSLSWIESVLEKFEGDKLYGAGVELVDFDSAQFELNHENRVQLEDIEIDVDRIIELVALEVYELFERECKEDDMVELERG